jgi:exodeoxyribonuclease VII small subunit
VTAKESETPISNPADSSDLTDDDQTDDDKSREDKTGNDRPGPEMGTGMTDTELAQILSLTYEQARDELISIVAQLEGGQIGLEESMALWQRGEALAQHCNTWLDGAEAKLTSVTEAKRNDQR